MHLLFHSAFRPFKYKLCNKAFKTKSHLKEHFQIQHNKIKKYKCTLCNCYFGRNSNLIIYVKTHSKIHLCSFTEENESECTQENSNEMHSYLMECDYDCEKIRNTFLLNEYDVSY